MKVTLLIPTMDEIEGMKAIMPKIKKEWYDQVIIIDKDSTDGTVEYAKEHGYLVHHQKGEGLWRAYAEVYDLVEGDIVIAFSPDGNSIPEIIPQLIEKMKEGYDMIIASRYLDGAKSYDDDVITAFGNRFFTKSINFFFKANYTDAMVMYRALKKDVIPKLDLDKEKSYRTPERLFFTKICLMPLLSIRAAKAKMKVTEIPGDEPKRIGGKRKLQIIRWGLSYYFQIFRELFFWHKDFSAKAEKELTYAE